MSADYDKVHDDNPAESMDVPIQMFDWRLWAVFLGFVVLILFVSAWMGTYWYLFPSSFILIALLFIFFHETKVTVGSGILRISTPILGDILIPENSIKKIEISENYANRHKLRSLVPIVVMVIMSINLTLTRQNSVMNKLYIIGIFGFVYLLYATIRISSYPKMIKMYVSGREILLYPRNEHDFLMLKGIADNKPV
ncbi:MAG: hypothetical protein OIN66_16895 [Candidatus Methanoperedens sp.]|nr:hypothetical protein [Candidatus Methanoperedens sp.]